MGRVRLCACVMWVRKYSSGLVHQYTCVHLCLQVHHFAYTIIISRKVRTHGRSENQESSTASVL